MAYGEVNEVIAAYQVARTGHNPQSVAANSDFAAPSIAQV
jgi:hypothetical protein